MKWRETSASSNDAITEWDLVDENPGAEVDVYGVVQRLARSGYRAMLVCGRLAPATYHLTLEDAKNDLLRQAVEWRFDKE